MKPDSIIFDMDGTLWDANDTYVKAWNNAFQRLHIPKTMSKSWLSGMVGWERKNVLANVLPEYSIEEREVIITQIIEIQDELIIKEGGKLYDGVKKGLQELSAKYPLLIVSNCAENTIQQMMNFCGISEFITDEIAHGVNKMPKSHNIALIAERNNLKKPFYVGDTEGDGIESRKANVPFVFVDYGFGKTLDYDYRFNSFEELTAYFMAL
jgi:phosphoglycolate phosphatase